MYTTDIYLLLLWAHTHKAAIWTKAITKMNPQRPLEFGARRRPIRRFRARFEDSDYDCVPPLLVCGQTKSDLRHFATAVSGVFHFN